MFLLPKGTYFLDVSRRSVVFIKYAVFLFFILYMKTLRELS